MTPEHAELVKRLRDERTVLNMAYADRCRAASAIESLSARVEELELQPPGRALARAERAERERDELRARLEEIYTASAIDSVYLRDGEPRVDLIERPNRP